MSWQVNMKRLMKLLFSLSLLFFGLKISSALGQEIKTPSNKVAGTKETSTKAVPAPVPDRNTPVSTQSDLKVGDLIQQGKSLYRSARFKQALAKFEAALKQEPGNDEALGLAAVTAFRLDNQAQSREFFLRRVELPGQKDSVKAYSFYRVALTYWREAHDVVAKYGDTESGKLVYNLPERDVSSVKDDITYGLDFVSRALKIRNDFIEAYNVKNLLHAEAALAEKDEKKAGVHRDQSIEALRRALTLAEKSAAGARSDTTDFSQPTIRIAEVARTKEDEGRIVDPMMAKLEGGTPKKRLQPIFPSVRSLKPSTDPNNPSGVGTSQDETVKVEILVSTTGNVVFAHIIEGHPEIHSAAIVAARSWKFEPAKFEGRLVQVSSVITFPVRQGQR
jgi:tetratricopeptide (TPR) repeat protein